MILDPGCDEEIVSSYLLQAYMVICSCMCIMMTCRSMSPTIVSISVLSLIATRRI
jgi:hypothetical protein